MAKKYYAVRKGIKTGIFNTWSEVEPLVKGFSGAEFQSFTSEEKAQEYMDKGMSNSEISTHNNISSEVTFNGNKITGAYAFIRSIINKPNDTYSYGGFIVNDGISYPVSGFGRDYEKGSNLTISSEIDGTISIVKTAKELGIKRLTILHEMEGIEGWVTGAWNARRTKTQMYRDTMREAIANGLAIRFVNINEIDGINGLEFAEQLAKQEIALSSIQISA